jgi:WXG100 family type VII secretion target
MENTLLVSPEVLKQTASNFGSQATQVKALHDAMLKEVSGLSSSWVGDAASSYMGKFQALSKGMDTINRMINEHVKDLETIATEYESAETTAKSAVDELPASSLD